MHIAAKSGDIAAAEHLLAEGAKVDARDANGRTPLHLTIEGECELGGGVSESNRQVATLLIARGANVNAEDKYGDAPLSKKVICDAVMIAKLLIDHGADLDHRVGQYTALEMASVSSPKVALLLVERGADVNSSDKHTLETPLHKAAYHGRKELVEALLAHGADVNTRDAQGTTPLENASDPSVIEAIERQ